MTGKTERLGVDNQQMHEVIDRLGDLPALPNVANEVLRLTDDPMTDMSKMSAAIERDPALTAKILRVSNSPYYGMRQYIGTLKLALVILGMREIRNIVLGVSVFETLCNGKHRSTTTTLTDHAFLTGALAKQLSQRLGAGATGEAFISGLLHDMGKLAMLRQLGAGYVDTVNENGAGSKPLLERERETYGFTHAEVGRALANKWNFPRPLADAIWLHHPVQGFALSKAKDPVLAALVRIANLAAHDCEQGGESESRAAREEEAWGLIQGRHVPVTVDERTQLIIALASEVVRAPVPIL